MKKLNPIYLIHWLLIMILGLSSCNKLIEVDQPTDVLTSEQVFSDQSTALSALNGLYIQLMNSGSSFSNSLITMTAGLSADELNLGVSNPVYDEFLINGVSVNNSNVNTLWSNAYTRIYQCNSLIERATASIKLPTPVRNKIIGEARFCRAFFYFYLVQLFGDVPLVTSTDYRQTAMLPRTVTEKVFDLIFEDLDIASKILLESSAEGKTRPGLWSAKALLARAYLYRKDWANALKISSELITSKAFSLEGNLSNVFLTGSKEAIWQLAPIDGRASTWEGGYFIPNGNVVPGFPITDHLVSSFESGDARKTNWIGIKTGSTGSYSYPFKYKVSGGTGAPVEYYTPLRFAEQYLIHAEASVNNGDLNSALKDLDQLRGRAGLKLYSNDGKSHTLAEVQIFIENERRHELFCEWGHRWFDLKRTERAMPVLGQSKPSLKATALLLPVPFQQIQYNAALVQNPGY